MFLYGEMVSRLAVNQVFFVRVKVEEPTKGKNMSTRITIDYNSSSDDSDFHLYFELCEADAVYLQLKNPKSFNVDTDNGTTFVTIRIPEAVMSKIANENILKRLQDHNDSCLFDKDGIEGY